MKKILSLLVLSICFLTGCTFNGNKTVIVKVNDGEITQKQFDEAYSKAVKGTIFKYAKLDASKSEDNIIYLMLKDRIVGELVIKELLNQEMAKRKIKITKEDVDNELKSIIDTVGSKELFNSKLKESGVSNDEFKASLEEEVKIKKLTNALGVKNVSDKDVENFYKQNPDKFKYPDMVRASHILVLADEADIQSELTAKNPKIIASELKSKTNEEMEKRQERARAILNEVKNNPDNFAAIAREKSEDTTSAKQGGDLGFFSKTDMVEPFASTAFSLPPNKISELVKTQYGYHIIKVTDRMEAGKEPFEKVKDRIKVFLINKNQVTVLENFVESLKKNAKIEYVNPDYNPESIKKLIKKKTSMAGIK